MPNTQAKLTAVDDFRQARRRAALQEIMARLTGRSIDLLSYEDVRQKFKIEGGSSRGLQEIPLKAIVGSVGRYTDFTRSFLPKQDNDQQRWVGVKTATLDLSGVPAIEVYKISDAYFVVDGNHRVSVARELGNTYIEAYVTEFQTKVPLTPDDQPEDIFVKAEYAHFLEKTNLDKLRPEANLQITIPGRYWELETQIEAHRYGLAQTEPSEIPYGVAVEDWYDNVYLPIIQIIRGRGLLRDFPKRTETDLYLWIFRHRSELEKQLGWQIDIESAVTNLASQHSPNRLLARLEGKLVDALTPDPLESGPAPGQWRREWLEARPRDRLFANILVPVSGLGKSWCALEQALLVAKHEQGQLYGLYVASSAEQAESDTVKEIQAEFNQQCQAAGVPGRLSIEVGHIARKIVDRARWADLVTLHLAHPPGSQPLAKLESGFRTILRRCPQPVLVVPDCVSSAERALVAYDGSPKAQEGLFIATYLAAHWQISLVIMTVLKQDRDQEKLSQAKEHLAARGVTTATFVSKRGPVAETILKTATEYECNLLIMGGYGSKPVVEVVLGSAVDQVLRESGWPMLVCR